MLDPLYKILKHVELILSLNVQLSLYKNDI